jgi:hypothetical protein
MHFEPQHAGHAGRIDPDIPPPCRFIAASMDLAMVPSAQRDSELIADLAFQRAALGKAQVMSIRRLPSANQARLPGNISNVISVTNSARLRQRQHALMNSPGPRSLVRPTPLRYCTLRGCSVFSGGICKGATLRTHYSKVRQCPHAYKVPQLPS